LKNPLRGATGAGFLVLGSVLPGRAGVPVGHACYKRIAVGHQWPGYPNRAAPAARNSASLASAYRCPL
jgi:hypothetical protein